MAEAAVAMKPEPVPDPPAAPVRIKELIIDLTYPVQAHGDIIKQIKFRRPTGADLMSIAGFPITIDWQSKGECEVNSVQMGAMMSVLAAVPPSTIKAMDAGDFSTCAHALMDFFIPVASQVTRS